MSVVYKYNLGLGTFRFKMSRSADVLCVHNQKHSEYPVSMWVAHTVESDEVVRKFHVIETGAAFDTSYVNWHYVGTSLSDEGRYVLHVFEEK